MSLCDTLCAIAPPGTACAAGPIGALQAPLLPPEASAMEAAVPKRVAEFTAGRTAARQALAALGLPAAPIPRNPDRSPLWPGAVTGAITHSRSHAAAIAAPASRFTGLGLDIEPDAPLKPDLIARILVETERDQPQTAKLRFTIKEAGYKALYPTYRRFVGFDEARTDLSPDGTCHIDILPDDWPGPRRITGRWARAEGHCIAVIAIPAP